MAYSPRQSAVRLVTLVLLALAVTTHVNAKESDRNQPVEVDADYADALATPNGVSHLRGDVQIVQGTLKATGDKADIHFDENTDVKSIVLIGSPAHVQQLDDNNNLMQGHANQIDYDVPGGVAVLTGDAYVDQQGRGSARGKQLTYDTVRSSMRATSRENERVHIIFQPDKNKQKNNK